MASISLLPFPSNNLHGNSTSERRGHLRDKVNGYGCRSSGGYCGLRLPGQFERCLLGGRRVK